VPNHPVVLPYSVLDSIRTGNTPTDTLVTGYTSRSVLFRHGSTNSGATKKIITCAESAE